jgi:hypothetical protein
MSWIFFWRRQPLPKVGEANREADLSPVTGPEPISMLQEQRKESNSPPKDARTLMLVHSNTIRVPELQYDPHHVEDDSEATPVRVLPAGSSILSQPASMVETKPQAQNCFRASKVDATNSADLARIHYFTHCSYAVASLGRPRLIAPDFLLAIRRARSPNRLAKQNNCVEAAPGNDQRRSPAAAQ